MAGPPFNATKHLQRQGIDPKITYAAVVVNNDDKSKRGRVQARVLGFMDGIEDQFLPWAIPSNNFGANKASGVNRSGWFDVPPIGSKIGLRFPLGDPHRAVQENYPLDDQVMMEESKTNYPFRKVLRFDNGFYIIVDTKTNELIFNNPGDMHMTILGDCTQTVIGDSMQIVSGAKGDIPAYLLNAPDTKLNEIGAKKAGKVQFKGLGAKGGGNLHHEVTGDYTLKVGGNRKVVIGGNDDVQVGRNRTEKIGATHSIKAARSETN